jgi:hypothetical protein
MITENILNGMLLEYDNRNILSGKKLGSWNLLVLVPNGTVQKYDFQLIYEYIYKLSFKYLSIVSAPADLYKKF